jgi:hypothetical protein
MKKKIKEDGAPAGAPAAAPAAPANVTGDSKNMAMPPTKGPVLRRYRKFDVGPETFRKFQSGKVRFEAWSKYLNLEDVNEKAIYDYATTNRDHVVILRDSSTGALRAIRRRPAN